MYIRYGIWLVLVFVVYGRGMAQENELVYFNKPAKVWTEALPVGNGRIGGMVFGGGEHERIALNEATLWSGGPVPQSINPDAKQYLPALRKAVMAEDYPEADRLARKMQGVWSESYLPLGDLLIHHEMGGRRVRRYRRYLDMEHGVAESSVITDSNNSAFGEQVFVSAPD